MFENLNIIESIIFAITIAYGIRFFIRNTIVHFLGMRYGQETNIQPYYAVTDFIFIASMIYFIFGK